MYLTPYQKKQLLTVIILVIGIPLTIFGVYKATQWIISASEDTQPKNVILTNLATNSITITWTTSDKVRGSIVPVLNGNEQGTVIDKRGNDERRTHHVELSGLEPGSEYNFKIISGEDTYTGDSNDEFSFTTANIAADTTSVNPFSGKIENVGDDVLVYVVTKDKTTYPVENHTMSNGNFIVDLSQLRKVSDRTFYSVSDSTELVIIAVSGVNQAGIIQGSLDTLVDSDNILLEDLTVEDSTEYIQFINEDVQLMAYEDTGDDPNPEPPIEPTPPDDDIVTPPDDDDIVTPPDDDDIVTPPDDIVTPPDDDDDEIEDIYARPFNRDFLIKNDLQWIDMVSTEGSLTSGPEVYGEGTVQTTNVTDTGFSVLWFSENKETGYIMYGTSSSDLADRGRDQRDGIASQGQYYLHSIEVGQLQPETKYYFQIHSGTNTFTNTYEITTFETQSSPPEFETITGTVNVDDNQSIAIVATFTDRDGIGSEGTSFPISTLVDSEGIWILTIGGARDSNGGYFDKSNNDAVTFTPMYLSEPPEAEMTIGEATAGEVELYISENVQKFVKIPLLSDYGIRDN
jgi:hypothetical protein